MTTTKTRQPIEKLISAEKLNSDKKKNSSVITTKYANPPRFDTENYFYYTEVLKELS